MESMREILGGQKMQIIEGLNADLRHAHAIIDDLLRYAGRPDSCYFCARPILRIPDHEGTMERFYNYDGEWHQCRLEEMRHE